MPVCVLLGFALLLLLMLPAVFFAPPSQCFAVCGRSHEL